MKTGVRRPSAALIIACVALFISLTGAGIAANHYLITSTKQIKPSVIKKLKGNKGAKGPRGAAGSNGSNGSIGSIGATGASGATHVVKRWAIGAAGASFSTAVATCNPGETVTGGGADYDSAAGGAIPAVRWNAPYPTGQDTTIPTGWIGTINNLAGVGTVTALTWVMCAQP